MSHGFNLSTSPPETVQPRPVLVDKASIQGTRVATFIIVALFSVSAALSATAAFRMVLQAGDVTEPESAVTTLALNFAKSGKLYSPLDRPPYTPVAYGPVLYLVLAGIARSFHLDFRGLLLAGRVLSLTCFLLLAATTYFAALRCGHKRWIAVIPAIFVITGYSFARWNVTVRPDMAAVLLSVLCIALLLIPTRGSVVGAAVCVAAAVLLKLSYVAAPVAVLIWLIWSRRYWYAVLFCATAGTIVVAVAAVFLLRGDPILSQVLIIRNMALSREALIQLALEQWH